MTTPDTEDGLPAPVAWQLPDGDHGFISARTKRSTPGAMQIWSEQYSVALYTADQMRAATASLRAEIERRDWFLESRGYRRCDIAACNCQYWHGGHAMQRLDEIRYALDEAGAAENGETTLHAVQRLLAARQEAP